MNMKGKARKELDRALKKEEILGAALKLFLSKGIKETKLEEIAESVYLTKPTIYYYFKSKDDIIEALVSKGWKQMLDVAKSYYDLNDPYNSFFNIVQHQMELYRTSYELLKFLFLASNQVSEFDSKGEIKEWAMHKRELMDMYEKLLVKLVGDQDRVYLIQKAIGGIVHGILNLGRPPREKDFENAMDFLKRILE